MEQNKTPACPCCGSQQLIASSSCRRVFINHQGERIPLLTVNYCLDRPVIEQTSKLFSCSCSWSGSMDECD